MIPKQEPVSLEKVGKFLKDIKDVPYYTLLAGFGFILIVSGMAVSKITGNNELSGVGIVLIVLSLAAYQNKRTKTSKKRKR